MIYIIERIKCNVNDGYHGEKFNIINHYYKIDEVDCKYTKYNEQLMKVHRFLFVAIDNKPFIIYNDEIFHLGKYDHYLCDEITNSLDNYRKIMKRDQLIDKILN